MVGSGARVWEIDIHGSIFLVIVDMGERVSRFKEMELTAFSHWPGVGDVTDWKSQMALTIV